MLLVTNQVVYEESEEGNLIQNLSGNANKDLNTISSLTGKLRRLFDINGQFKYTCTIHTSPEILLAEVKYKSKTKINLEKMDVNEMFINEDHEVLVAAFIAIIEVLGAEDSKALSLSYYQEDEESIFEFHSGHSLLTDSLKGAYALELLRSMKAKVKWTVGKVTVSFKLT